MDKDNANPTVLNLSQLPKRQARKKAVLTGPGAKYHDIIFSKPAYLSSSDDESDWGADDADADGDFAVEPIDEQEVYGKMPSQRFLVFLCLVFLLPCVQRVANSWVLWPLLVHPAHCAKCERCPSSLNGA